MKYDNVKITSVIAYKEDGVILGEIFRTVNSELCSGKKEKSFEDFSFFLYSSAAPHFSRKASRMAS